MHLAYPRLFHFIHCGLLSQTTTTAANAIQAAATDGGIVWDLHVYGPFANLHEASGKWRISMSIHIAAKQEKTCFSTRDQNATNKGQLTWATWAETLVRAAQRTDRWPSAPSHVLATHAWDSQLSVGRAAHKARRAICQESNYLISRS